MDHVLAGAMSARRRVRLEMGPMQMFRRLLVVATAVVATAWMAVVAAPAGAGQPTPAPSPPPGLKLMTHDPASLMIRGQPQRLFYLPTLDYLPFPAGMIFVRNDTQQAYTRLPLVEGSDKIFGRALTVEIPATLLRGQRVYYYAEFSGASVGGALTVPEGGANSPQTAVILDKPMTVTAGEQEIGPLTPFQAVVAQARADQVGWYEKPDVRYGPWSFEIGADGSVWVLDEVNDRLLVWPPGKPNAPARAVPVPGASIDFALARDAIYVTSHPAGSGPTSTIYRLASDGTVRWRTTTSLETGRLAVGPDAVLYEVDTDQDRWLPVTTAAGAPLPVSERVRRARDGAPVAGGGRLVIDLVARREYRVALLDAKGLVVRSWRVTSTNTLEGASGGLSGMVGGDPVLFYGASRPAPPDNLLHNLVMLRLTSAGAASPLRLKQSIWGDFSEVTHFIAADGKLYELRTSRTTGISVVRYSLGPVAAPSPTGTGAAPSPTPPAAVVPTATAEPTAATPPAPSEGTAWWPWLVALASLVLAGVASAVLLLRRYRRRPAVPLEQPALLGDPADTEAPGLTSLTGRGR